MFSVITSSTPTIHLFESASSMDDVAGKVSAWVFKNPIIASLGSACVYAMYTGLSIVEGVKMGASILTTGVLLKEMRRCLSADVSTNEECPLVEEIQGGDEEYISHALQLGNVVTERQINAAIVYAKPRILELFLSHSDIVFDANQQRTLLERAVYYDPLCIKVLTDSIIQVNILWEIIYTLPLEPDILQIFLQILLDTEGISLVEAERYTHYADSLYTFDARDEQGRSKQQIILDDFVVLLEERAVGL